ncbi:Iron-regulated protein A precursor [Sulfitobacter sp. THAF37]|uniref:imelysin family protein n=1 Tax=Sulfitobacter sp. THAF37 TaxID=2587855 RepID=UPI0012688E80|nr:imelysin family protein [Sulfitobacter sp. THAF37]QFT57414.1 Iron-regulated protein A precursor [Sulfitobacter sp. THAF37]
MKQLTILLAALLLPLAAAAQNAPARTADVVNNHILPRVDALSDTARTLAGVAQTDCETTSPELRAAFHDSFDAWISASHLRFGPTEVGDRGFALAFWPDSRGATPGALAGLIADRDPVIDTAEGFAQVSIAARGFYALDYLLYDTGLTEGADAAYLCALVRAVSTDIAATSRAIREDWRDTYAEAMLTPGPDAPYRSEQEVLKQLFTALTTGLEFTAETRMGRPLGTFERSYPARAEAWRSGRSARNVRLSLLSLRDLADRLATGHPKVTAALDSAFVKPLDRLETLDDPVFAGVAEPQSRLRIEVIQQDIAAIRALARADLGPTLGVAAGFNSMDGD